MRLRNRRPDGTIGCYWVPHPHIGLEPPIWVPPGANQTVANRSEPGSYRFSDTPTFTRDVDILPESHRLVNGDARCAMGYQRLAELPHRHGFAFASIWGKNW